MFQSSHDLEQRDTGEELGTIHYLALDGMKRLWSFLSLYDNCGS